MNLLRRKLKPPPEPQVVHYPRRDTPREYLRQYGWGRTRDFCEPYTEEAESHRVYGFSWDRPRPGDLFIVPMERGEEQGEGVFEFVCVDWCRDPRDAWWGTVVFRDVRPVAGNSEGG